MRRRASSTPRDRQLRSLAGLLRAVKNTPGVRKAAFGATNAVELPMTRYMCLLLGLGPLPLALLLLFGPAPAIAQAATTATAPATSSPAFEESPTGAVSAMNLHRPGGQLVMRLAPVTSTLPSVAEIMRGAASGRPLPSLLPGARPVAFACPSPPWRDGFHLPPPETTNCERTLVSAGQCRCGRW